jgi:hypothetical protein
VEESALYARLAQLLTGSPAVIYSYRATGDFARVACLMTFSITALALSTSKSPGAICKISCRAVAAFLAYSLGVCIASNLFTRVVSIYPGRFVKIWARAANGKVAAAAQS